MESKSSASPQVKTSKDNTKTPMDPNCTIMRLIHSFTDLIEKTGFKRKRPNAKATLAATINIIIPMLITNELKDVWGLKMAVAAPITIAIGTTTNQLWTNRDLTSLDTPDGALFLLFDIPLLSFRLCF